jgi:hypothetical protein
METCNRIVLIVNQVGIITNSNQQIHHSELKRDQIEPNLSRFFSNFFIVKM